MPNSLDASFYATTPIFYVNDAPHIDISCYRQTEYAGVLTKAKNKAGAQTFVEFLLSNSIVANCW